VLLKMPRWSDVTTRAFLRSPPLSRFRVVAVFWNACSGVSGEAESDELVLVDGELDGLRKGGDGTRPGENGFAGGGDAIGKGNVEANGFGPGVVEGAKPDGTKGSGTKGGATDDGTRGGCETEIGPGELDGCGLVAGGGCLKGTLKPLRPVLDSPGCRTRGFFFGRSGVSSSSSLPLRWIGATGSRSSEWPSRVATSSEGPKLGLAGVERTGSSVNREGCRLRARTSLWNTGGV